MDQRSIAHAVYWRQTLADAQLGKGALSKTDEERFTRLARAVLMDGRLPERLTESLFDKQPKNVSSIKAMLRPFVYRARHRHGQAHGNQPYVVSPIMTPVDIARNGQITLDGETRMARDLLEPNLGTAFTIGHIDAFDDYLTQKPVERSMPATTGKGRPTTDWPTYLESCRSMLEAVCAPGWSYDSFELIEDAFIEPGAARGGTTANLLPLYDDMKTSIEAPLFDTYAGDRAPPVEPCLIETSYFTARLAHSSPDYALARAQRRALSHTIAARHGEIVAVNGPPGTGKTTLLLSVVATLWAKTALAEGKPPIIVAASTNNQAVTNIIDAFGTDFAQGSGPLAGRWLPSLKSFGAFYASVGKKKEVGDRFQTDDFFAGIESPEFLKEAEAAYLSAASHAFPELIQPDVPAIVAALHGALVREAARLGEIEAAWQARDAARADISRLLGSEPDRAIEELRRAFADSSRRHDEAVVLARAWSEHLANESLATVLLEWLPPVARQRNLRARIMLSSVWPKDQPELSWKKIGDVEPALVERLKRAGKARDEDGGVLQRAEATLEALKAAERRCELAVAGLGLPIPAHAASLSDCEGPADRTIRFEIFRLATHYWEGRWLIDMRSAVAAKTLGAPRTLDDLDQLWRRRMMLTPCVVSTFYTLPRHLSVWERKAEGNWGNTYLYDTVDLLIVDEAGQVTPEVAGASFALARRALVIGDTLQIEPIWSTSRGIDMGNLAEAKLLPEARDDQVYKAFELCGKASASGSVMKIAQRASRFHQEPALSRGLMLLEHRRCFDEIVGYCNTLCYEGKLEPLRGSKRNAAPGKGRDGLPAMGHLHIDGICLTNRNGSRYNQTEAETIARWLQAHRGGLERDYGTSLDRIVGIVTPFGAQRTAIVEACKAVGIQAGGREGELTVGTVHALQGAQRPVVLFSPVYSKHADGTFIDRSPSMLNVAVSRAMNSFLVFGDMDVIVAAASTTPRGRLAAVLQCDEANALVFEPVERRDLTRAGARLQQLQDAREHDAFLTRMFEEAIGNLLIVTPWIKLERIHEIGALEAMRRAVARGVVVEVYADRRLNLNDARLGPERSREMVSGVRDALAEIGVAFILVEQIHSKIVIADDRTYCIGSFNWFSAQRVGQHVRAETSLVYEGDELAEEIQTTKASLKKLADRAATRMRV